ncbi:hypothetical protein JAAARDRAFT_75415 [Jaapia argillacea MUCL 33604]|uniref:MARVEL domain-containing protein n=1 Tax=Jaapia argillacea MUCL 33604 TaxID=933084 RepID=A0A067QD95_9AGAM|nr:hypothetical protein JAAARDRAFT_75415 [Jaapia argillacea MUCL 33604]
MVAFFPIFRRVILVTLLLFSIVVLGLSAHMIYFTETHYGGYLISSALAIAVSIITILVVSFSLVVDFLQQNVFTSIVVVDLAFQVVLWALWVATGADTADADSQSFPDGCIFIDRDVDHACREFTAIQAFSFLNWLLIMGYAITLFSLAIIGRRTHGDRIWTSRIHTHPFMRDSRDQQDGQSDDAKKGGTSTMRQDKESAPEISSPTLPTLPKPLHRSITVDSRFDKLEGSRVSSLLPCNNPTYPV